MNHLNRVVRAMLRPGLDEGPSALGLLRAGVGYVFITSGALKFLFENQGPIRFARLGFPAGVAYFVGAVEIVCGVLVLLGFFARLAALPLVIDMAVAIATTKMPLLFGAGPEPIAAAPKTGLLAFAYQARLDIAMFLACGTIVLVGAGFWSVDAWLAKKRVEGQILDRTRAETATS